jgi:hypothetical protein
MSIDNPKYIISCIREYRGDDELLLLVRDRIMSGHALTDDQLLYAKEIIDHLAKADRFRFTIDDIPF